MALKFDKGFYSRNGRGIFLWIYDAYPKKDVSLQPETRRYTK